LRDAACLAARWAAVCSLTACCAASAALRAVPASERTTSVAASDAADAVCATAARAAFAVAARSLASSRLAVEMVAAVGRLAPLRSDPVAALAAAGRAVDLVVAFLAAAMVMSS
jgi:hypothetical protein